jgi:hypothetical protein
MRMVLAGQVHGAAVARSHLLASCCDVATIVPPELLCPAASDCAIALPSRRSAPYKRRAMSSHLRAILPLSHTIFASTALCRTLPPSAALCRTRVAVPLICSVTALRWLLSLSTEPPFSNSSSHAAATLCRTVALCRTLPHSAALELPCPRTDQSQLFACFCRSRSCPRSVTALHMLLPHSAARCRTLPHSAALRRTLPNQLLPPICKVVLVVVWMRSMCGGALCCAGSWHCNAWPTRQFHRIVPFILKSPVQSCAVVHCLNVQKTPRFRTRPVFSWHWGCLICRFASTP